MEKEKAKEEGLGGKDFLFMMVSICQYLFFVVIIKDKDKKLHKYFFRIGRLNSVED